MLNNRSILITGGTGSFGKKFIEQAIKKYKKIKRLVIFSRDELKQYELKKLSTRKNKIPPFIVIKALLYNLITRQNFFLHPEPSQHPY